MSVRRLFHRFFLVILQLYAFFLKLLLDGYDFLLLSSKLLTNFMNLALKLFLELNNTFLAPLQVCGFNSHFVFKCSDLCDCFVKRNLALLLFEFPVLGQLIDFFDFFLFEVRHEFCHLCALPHFELPNDLVLNGVSSLDWHCGRSLGERFAIGSLNYAKVFEVKDYSNQAGNFAIEL